jgi:hypothetical protein
MDLKDSSTHFLTIVAKYEFGGESWCGGFVWQGKSGESGVKTGTNMALFLRPGGTNKTVHTISGNKLPLQNLKPQPCDRVGMSCKWM